MEKSNSVLRTNASNRLKIACFVEIIQLTYKPNPPPTETKLEIVKVKFTKG